MSLSASWRARNPDLAVIFDDARVHAVLIDVHGNVEIRALDGVALDLRAPKLKAGVVRALAKESSDAAYVISSIPARSGLMVHISKRPKEPDRPIDSPLGGLIEPNLALGASILVVGPRAASRAEVVATLARLIKSRRRALSIDPRDPDGIPFSALSALAFVDDAIVIAGDLSALDAGAVIRAPVPCLASMPGLTLESGIARLAGQLALERPGLAHPSISAAITGRFDLALELDETRIVAVAELSLDTRGEGGVGLSRIAVRAPGGAFELALGGTRVERRLSGLIEGAHSPSTRPERAPPRIRTGAARLPPTPSAVMRAPLVREAPPAGDPSVTRNQFSQRETQELSPKDPLETTRAPSAQLSKPPPLSSRLAPIVEPPPMSSQSPARAAISGPSGMRDVPEATSDLLSPAPLSASGRLQLDAMSELTPDQLVSQSFILDTGYQDAPDTRLVSEPPVGLDFDEPTSAGEVSASVPPPHTPVIQRAPLERQTTEIADAKSGSLMTPLPAPKVVFGESTMQLEAALLRPASVEFMDEATIDPALDGPLTVAPPPPVAEDDQENRTSFGLLAQDEEPPVATPKRRKRTEN